MTEKTPLKEDYNYYDDYDIEDINTGETRHGTDASGAGIGLLGGGLALLACLVMVALTAVIFHRDMSHLPLCHLIMVCLGVLIAAFGIFMCLQARKAEKNNTEPNHMLMGIAFFLCMMMLGYCVASAFFFYMFRPFHHCHLVKKHVNGTEWNDTFGSNWTFEDGWGEDRRILWWITFFTVVAAVGFLILAIVLWKMTKYKVQMARIILGLACLAGVILACFALDYLWTSRTMYENYVFRAMNHKLFTALIVLLVVIVVLLLANAIWNVLHKRSGHFVLGTVLLVVLFIFACILGLILRDLRQRQLKSANNPQKCAALLDALHQDDIKDSCPNKYLSGQCTKSYLVSKWESKGEAAFLNPGCCGPTQCWSDYPLFLASKFCFLLIACLIIAIAMNYFLSDTSEYLDFSDKSSRLFEIICVVGIVLTLIAFGFYFGFRPSDKVPRTNSSSPLAQTNIYGGIKQYEDKSFTPVDLPKVYDGTVPESVYYNPAINSGPTITQKRRLALSQLKTKDQIMTFKLDCGTKPNCGGRFGVLAINGKFPLYTNHKNVGTKQARHLFFDDQNINDDFMMVHGTQAELNALVANLYVTPHKLEGETDVVFNGERIADLTKLDNLGLKSSESPKSVTLTSSGKVFNDFVAQNYKIVSHKSNPACYATNSCVSSLVCFELATHTNCRKAFRFLKQTGSTQVTLPLTVTDANGKVVNYSENGVRATAFYTYNGRQYNISPINLVGNKLVFDVPKPVSGSVPVTLNISDANGHYLPTSRSFSVSQHSDSKMSIQTQKLLTSDGKGCVGAKDVNACWAAKQSKFTSIEVKAVDSDDLSAVEDIPVKLYSGVDGSKFVASKNSNDLGYATFENAAYDYYTVKFDGNDTFLPTSQQIPVQSDIQGDATLYLHKRSSTSAVIEQYVNNSGTQDQDLALSITSHSGTTCKVDPLSKYCGYSHYMNDIGRNTSGYERVKIDKFTTSHYLAMLQSSPAYSGTCGAADISKYQYYPGNENTTLRSLGYQWHDVVHFQVT